MKSSIAGLRPRTKITNLLTSSSATLSASNKPPSNTGSSSGIPKLTVSSSGGGARPKAGKKPVAAASTPSSALSASTKRFAASSTDKPTRARIESSSASRIPGKKKVPHCVRPRLTASSAISKREKPVLDAFGSVTPGRRGGATNSNLGGSRRIGCAPIDKRTVAGMHRSTVAHAATASSGHDKTMKPPPAMASLNRLEREKCELEHRVSELVHNAETKKAEVVNLRGEIGKLKEQNKSRSETVLLENESLHAENQFLRERLEELGFSLDGHTGGRALSDTEKEMLLLSESSKKFKCSSAPPSISGNGNNSTSPCCHNSSDDVPFDVEVLSGGAYVAAADVRGSIEWDKQSSSNVSEVSVACLQDRILQMEETHYSTSEELQATLQELSDLQDQLTELQADNERLAEEKAMFLESLCAKVQQLEECRAQLDALRRQFHARESSCTSEQATCHILGDDRDVATKLANDVATSDEFKRLCSLLEAERFKVAELTLSLGRDANLSATDKSALDQLETVRREKERFEARASALQEQLNVGQCETIRLREQLAVQQEEFAVAKRTAGELEFRLDQALAARDEVNARARELERACRSHSDERRELRKALAELERRAGEEAGRAESSRRQLEEASARHARDAEEWRQFQADLLMAVRVANDFKTEAQRDGERLAAETRTLLDRVQALEAENERLAKTLKVTTSPTFQRSTTTTTTMTSTSSYDMRQSVKSLIETIENASKSGVLDLPQTPSSVPCSPTADKPRPQPILRHTDSDYYVKSPTPSIRPVSADVSSAFQKSQSTNAVRPSIRPSRQRNSYAEGTVANSVNVGSPTTTMERSPLSSKLIGGSVVVVQTAEGCDHGSPPATVGVKPAAVVSPTPVSILANKSTDVVVVKRSSFGESSNEKKDPLAMLARGGGSRRNALLKWCQSRTIGYKGIDITNFSSSWNDGLAFCALVHTYLPDIVPYESLDGKDKRRNFTIAFQAAESVGIPTMLNIGDMISMERPDWQSVMTYVTSIYKHFET